MSTYILDVTGEDFSEAVLSLGKDNPVVVEYRQKLIDQQFQGSCD